METTPPRLAVLVVDDEPALREVLSLRIADWGYDVRTAADVAEAERELDRHPPDLVLCDVVLPGGSGLDLLKRIKRQDERLPVVMITAHGDIDRAVEAMKIGRRRFSHEAARLRRCCRRCSRPRPGELRQRQESRSLDAQLCSASIDATGTRRTEPLDARAAQDDRDVVAATDASAILTGESGTGKEVVARAIHSLSSRRDKPFIAINAAAIPEGLIESEVFGHEQGAFTGATKSRPGVFELANGGTLFLDEIAEMPISLQPKLLRILEEGRARRLGGSKEIPFDVRVIAATNRSPAASDSRRTAARGSVLPAQRVRAPDAAAARSRRRRRPARAALHSRVQPEARHGRAAASATRRASCSRRMRGPATSASCAT